MKTNTNDLKPEGDKNPGDLPSHPEDSESMEDAAHRQWLIFEAQRTGLIEGLHPPCREHKKSYPK